jgi:hypothetical protein
MIMMNPPPIIFPKNLNIGDTWAFNMAAGNYGTPPWSAEMTFASGTAKLTEQATLQGAVFYWLIASSATSTLPSGTLIYTVAVKNPQTSERYTLQEGTIQALPDLGGGGAPFPSETALQQLLAACDATLLQLLSQRTSSVVFAGKAYTLWDIEKLWNVRNKIYFQVQSELEATSGNSRQQIIIPVFKNSWGGPTSYW